jgi:hypothetical protein
VKIGLMRIPARVCFDFGGWIPNLSENIFVWESFVAPSIHFALTGFSLIHWRLSCFNTVLIPLQYFKIEKLPEAGNYETRVHQVRIPQVQQCAHVLD